MGSTSINLNPLPSDSGRKVSFQVARQLSTRGWLIGRRGRLFGECWRRFVFNEVISMSSTSINLDQLPSNHGRNVSFQLVRQFSTFSRVIGRRGRAFGDR